MSAHRSFFAGEDFSFLHEEKFYGRSNCADRPLCLSSIEFFPSVQGSGSSFPSIIDRASSKETHSANRSGHTSLK